MAIEQQTEGEEELLPVIQWLTDEFGLEVDARTIQRVAMEEWALFDRAKVRLYVRTISWRLARLRLREYVEGVRNLEDGVATHSPSIGRGLDHLVHPDGTPPASPIPPAVLHLDPL
jgi:hypothetical protein